MAGLGLLETELTKLLTSLVPAGTTRINPRLQENFVSQLGVIPGEDERFRLFHSGIKAIADSATSPQMALKEIVPKIFNTMFFADGLVNPACFGCDEFAERCEIDHHVRLMIALLKKACPEHLWNSIDQRDRWLDALKHKFHVEHAGKRLGEPFNIEDVVDTANQQFGHLLSPPPAPRRRSIFSPLSQASDAVGATPPAKPVPPPVSTASPTSPMPPSRDALAVHTRAASGGYAALTSPIGSVGTTTAVAPPPRPEGWCAFILRTLCCCCLPRAVSHEGEEAPTPRVDFLGAASARAMLASPTGVGGVFFPGSPIGAMTNPMFGSSSGTTSGPLSPDARSLAVARAAFFAAQQRVDAERRDRRPAGMSVASR